ncbi:MAG: phage tail-like protein [Crocinitomicaceae bacterium]|jgi:phage tail-like protein
MDIKSNYPVSFYFSLLIKGEELAFKSVSGISKELVLEEVVSGGENRFKYKLPTASKYQNLVLSRPVETDKSAFIQWFEKSIDTGLQEGITTQDVTLFLLGKGAKPLLSWTFHEAYPVKYSISELDSMENSLVIETFELAYTYFDIRH